MNQNMIFELNTENKRLERLFKDYHKHFVQTATNDNLTYHYEIYSGSGIGLSTYIVCDQTGTKGDITDYSEW